jgi:hypothetical protein
MLRYPRIVDLHSRSHRTNPRIRIGTNIDPSVDQPRPHGCPSMTMVWAGQKNAGPVAANNRAEPLA